MKKIKDMGMRNHWSKRSEVTFAQAVAIFLLCFSSFATLDEQPPYLRIEAPALLEPVSNQMHLVWDLHERFSEEPAIREAGLKAIRANQIFKAGTFFFGFGLPNVYLAKVDENGDVFKVDAKSVRRQEMKIVDTHGKVQSGILLVPTNLDQEVIATIEKIAKKYEGSMDWTCVRSNCAILGEAGFTVNDKPISEYYMPHSLLQDILRYGLRFNNQVVTFDLVKTTGTPLQEYLAAIKSAVLKTPIRHAWRSADTEEAQALRVAEAKRMQALNEQLLHKYSVDDVKEDSAATKQQVFDLELSQTSDLGALLRRLWGAHGLYRIKLPEGFSIDEFLPAKLVAFPQENPSWATWFKKKVIFAPSVVSWIHSHMAAAYKPCRQVGEQFLCDLLPVYDNQGLKNRFNMVITGEHIILAKLEVGNATVDWTLGKHAVVSGYSQDVRFAGELRKEERVLPDGSTTSYIVIDGNSGTYRPDRDQLLAAVNMISALFPHLDIVGEENLVEG